MLPPCQSSCATSCKSVHLLCRVQSLSGLTPCVHHVVAHELGWCQNPHVTSSLKNSQQPHQQPGLPCCSAASMPAQLYQTRSSLTSSLAHLPAHCSHHCTTARTAPFTRTCSTVKGMKMCSSSISAGICTDSSSRCSNAVSHVCTNVQTRSGICDQD